MKAILEHQRKRFLSGNTRSHGARMETLGRLREAIESNQDEILEALHDDLGKGETEAYASEVAYVLGEIRFAMRHLKGWMKRQRKSSPLSLWRAKSWVQPEPSVSTRLLSSWASTKAVSCTKKS